MPVIKGRDSATLVKGAIVLDMGDLRAQAGKIKAAAQEQALQIIQQAQQQAVQLAEQAKAQAIEQGTKQGLEQGLVQGRAQGRTEALSQMKQRLEAAEKAMLLTSQQVESRLQQMSRESRAAVLELALTLAEKLVHRVVEVDPAVIERQLDAALSYVLRPVEVTVQIAPQDRATLEEALPRLLEQHKHLKHFHLMDDNTISPGGCVVTYGQGRIDATLQTQLQRIVQIMIPGDTRTLDLPAATPEPQQSQEPQPPQSDDGSTQDRETT